MKKKIIAALMLAMAMSLTACGGRSGDSNGSGKNESREEKDDKKEDKKDDKKDDSSSGKEGGTSFCSMGYEADGDDVVFTIRTKAWLCSDAWLGICPDDYYVTESDADSVDEIYAYSENYYDEDGYHDEDMTEYIFVMDSEFGSIEKGTYTMVLCNCDGDGDIIAQWAFKYKGDGKFSIDFENGFYNEYAPTSDPNDDWDDDNWDDDNWDDDDWDDDDDDWDDDDD